MKTILVHAIAIVALATALGGLALAVGILVDEATVAVENIHAHLAMLDLRVRQIHRDGLLVAVDRTEFGAVARRLALRVRQETGPEQSKWVASTQVFHLDHLGTEVGQHLARPPGQRR